MIRRQGGFTLLEILVALVVLGFLVVGLTQGVHFGLRAWELQARTIGRREDLDSIDRTLRRLIENMDPGTSTDPLALQGRATGLAFTTDLPMAVPAYAGTSLPIRRADVSLGVDAAHRLVLRWTPHLHAVRFGPAPAPLVSELLRGIDHLDLAYRGAAAGGGWQSSWNQAALPGLVRIRLIFAEGDPRRWPDVVAAPVRDRIEEE
jgi:general secretion pathway protein J